MVTEKVRIDIVRAVIDRGVSLGFELLNVLPKAYDCAKKKGLDIKESQQLKHAFVEYEGKQYVVQVLELKNNETVWAVFELLSKPNPYGYGHFGEFISRGFVNDKLINTNKCSV